jgi:hypothetical protein
VTPVVPSSYESIATVTGTGSSATITFSSIPSTYKSLQIRMNVKDTGTSGNFGVPGVRLNGDSGANYSAHSVLGNGTTASANPANAINQMDNAGSRIVPDSTIANIMYVAIIDLIDYASTSKNKTIRWFDGADTNGAGLNRVEIVSGAWYNTSAVNSISILLTTGNAWTTTSTFALYGMK